MTDVRSTEILQLQYCPICHHLIRPSMFQAQEAVFQDGQYFHATCLAKGKQPSGRNMAQVPDFDNEEGVNADFGNYDQVVVQSISGLRRGRPGTGPQIAVRRKTTSAASTGAASRVDDAPAARRSSMVLRSYQPDSAKKKGNPAVIVGVVVGLLAILGIGGLMVLSHSSTENQTANNETDSRATARPAPPRPANLTPSPNTAAPMQTGTAPGPATSTLPPAPAGHTPDGADSTGAKPMSPYEQMLRDQQNNPNPRPAGTAPAPAPAYEAAGPTVDLFDGVSLNGWRTVKTGPGETLKVVDGAMEFNPGDSPVSVEHDFIAADGDFSFEARIEPDVEKGAYMEFWVPQGAIMMTAGHFQADQFTPVTVQLRDGKVVAMQGNKGRAVMEPCGVDPKKAAGDRDAYMGSKQVVMFFVSTNCRKWVRNIKFTPMRPVAVPVPVPAPAPSTATLPIDLPCDRLEAPVGKWNRVDQRSEAGKSFVTWKCATNNDLVPFYEFAPRPVMPDKVVVHIEYRIRAAKTAQLTARFYRTGNDTITRTVDNVVHETWQTSDLEFSNAAGTLEQIEIRLDDNPGPTAELDIAQVSFRAVPGATPPPAVVGNSGLIALPITIKGDLLNQPLGEWKRMLRASDAGKEYVVWDRARNLKQEPFFAFAERTRELPPRFKVKIEYRLLNQGGSNLLVRFWSNAKHTEDLVFPGKQENTWVTQEFEAGAPPGPLTSMDLRLDGQPDDKALFQICSVVISPVEGAGATAADNPPATPPTGVASSTAPAGTPSGPQTLKFRCAAMQGPQGQWFRLTALVEGDTNFMRWEQQASYPFFRNAGPAKLPLHANIRIRARLKNNDENMLLLHMYSTGNETKDVYLRMTKKDAEGWAVYTGALENTYSDFREFEIKPSAQKGEGMVMDLDAVEFYGTESPEVTPAPGATANDPQSPAGVPGSTVNSAGAGPAAAPARGMTVLRLEGVRDEKIGSWSRVAGTTSDGRSVVVFEDNPKHSPAFCQFARPAHLPLPAKILVRACFRANVDIGNFRVCASQVGGGEEVIAGFKFNAADVGKWIEVEAPYTTNGKDKTEIYLKYGNYPEGLKVEIDWIEILDPSQPATGTVGAPNTPAATVAAPGGAVPAVKGGIRIAQMPAGLKKLTSPKSQVYVQPKINSSLTTPGMSQRLFDGDTTGGIFSMTNPDPVKRNCWLVVDLGEIKSVSSVKLWNFFNTGRTYGSQVWQLSASDDFQRGVVTVFNSDSGNIHGQGAGTDPAAAATDQGTAVAFTPVRARYLRIFGNGNNDNGDNHILEIEVWGSDDASALAVPPHVAAGDIKLNAGREQIPEWSSAALYCMGGLDQRDATKPIVLPNTTLNVSEALFASLRAGVMTWKFPKALDGNYWVRLYFNEPTMTTEGNRMFDVIVNGETVLKDFDPFKAAGGAHRGVIETVATVAENGKGVVVEFKSVKGAPIVSAVELLPTDGPLAPPKSAVP